jgi:group I intron endonuclease
MKLSGIYKIQSKKKPKRIYIGSAVNIHRRWNEHKCKLLKNKHHSPKLQNHYNKYGGADLEFSILIGCEKQDLIKHEQYFIDALKPYFNISITAGSCLGMKLSEEAKSKISESNRRRIISQETKEKMRKALTGKTASAETREKMSKTRKGKKFTEEHKQKIREANKGRIFTEEHKEKIKIARRKRITTEETKRRLSISHSGEKNSFFGKHHTEETKQKIRNALLKRIHKPDDGMILDDELSEILTKC